MTLSELRRFIFETREREGVNWYLFDATPIFGQSGLLFTLHCYDEAGEIAQRVPFIEERAGRQIPIETLSDIADARAHAGVNGYFLRKIVKKRPIGNMQAFLEARARWLDEGRKTFLDALP